MNLDDYRKEWERVNRKRSAYFGKYKRRAGAALVEQLNPVFRSLEAGNNGLEIIKRIDDLISPDPIKRLFKDLYPEVGGDFALDTVRSLKSRGLQMDFKNEDRLSVWRQYLRNYALNEAGEKIETITETSKRRVVAKIRLALDESLEQGLGGYGTKELIKKKLEGERGISKKFRADRIARTEIVSASNRGSFVGASSSPSTLLKSWLASLDGRERIEHRVAFSDYTESPIPLDQTFRVGVDQMDHPGDFKGSASNVINCRCVIVYVRPEEVMETVPPPPELYETEDGSGRFIPAQSRNEVIQRARALGFQKISYGRVELSQANAALEALEAEYKSSPFKIPKLTIGSRQGNTLGYYSNYNIKGDRVPDEIFLNMRPRGVRLKPVQTIDERIKDLNIQAKAIEKQLSEKFGPEYAALKVRHLENEILTLKDKKARGLKYWEHSNSSLTDDPLEKIKRTTIHEIGHYRDLTQALRAGIKRPESSRFKWSPSEYGETNQNELYAETYSFWRVHGPQGLDPQIIKYFETILKP